MQTQSRCGAECFQVHPSLVRDREVREALAGRRSIHPSSVGQRRYQDRHPIFLLAPILDRAPRTPSRSDPARPALPLQPPARAAVDLPEVADLAGAGDRGGARVRPLRRRICLGGRAGRARIRVTREVDPQARSARLPVHVGHSTEKTLVHPPRPPPNHDPPPHPPESGKVRRADNAHAARPSGEHPRGRGHRVLAPSCGG